MDKDEIRQVYNIDPDLPAVVEILKHARSSHHKKGDVILRPYDESRYWYRIRKGLVKLYTINPLGEKQILLIYGPGDIFPLSWIIGRKTQNVYFEALTDCELRYGPQDVLLKHLKEDANVTYAILRKVLEQFLAYTARVNNLELKYGRDRLAYRLLVMATRFGEHKEGAIYLPFISQQDLAATLNMSRESVNREMHRFERLGIVKYTRKNISILKPEKLRKEIGADVDIEFYD